MTNTLHDIIVKAITGKKFTDSTTGCIYEIYGLDFSPCNTEDWFILARNIITKRDVTLSLGKYLRILEQGSNNTPKPKSYSKFLANSNSSSV